ncbi:beta-ketoacyl-ACP synthase [Thalassotalea ganghwensis]
MSFLHELGIVCSLGDSKSMVIKSLLEHPEREYLSPWEQAIDSDKTFICGQACVAANALPDLSMHEHHFHSRNNQLAMIAFSQIKEHFLHLTAEIPPARVAIVIGTSTSGIKEGEIARSYFNQHGSWPTGYDYHVQEMSSPAEFLAKITKATGPVYSISTACSSSAKALASAKKLLEQDMADIVICGGVDSLSHLPNNGFNSLESIAQQYCQPLSSERDGINIGEGAALFIMSSTPAKIKLCGTGETSDAHHISAPHPEGEGALAAMKQAIASAQLSLTDINYLNLHGTATPKNDEMETKAVEKLFGNSVPCSSTKRYTGHTLGAAGAIEAGILWLLLSDYNSMQRIPVNKSDYKVDPKLANIQVCQGAENQKLNYVMSNSFAFGGNNISIILGNQS